MEKLEKDAIAFFNRLTRLSRRCTEAVLEGKPRCHYPILHRVAAAIELCGNGESIYVSDLSRSLGESPQAVSRALRILEQDNLVERCSDPDDRRKTMVRLTASGRQDHDACAKALQAYGASVAQRMGAERLRRMQEDFCALMEAMEAESISKEEETHD